jgi:hypothetical protein
MGDLLREANQVIRGLFRSPGFTLLAVLALATLLLFMVALTAGYIPAKRATPAIALSSE